MTEIEKLRQRLKSSVMNDLQQERLVEYFKPIYYVEFECTAPGELFPRIFRNAYYVKQTNRTDALRTFDEFNGLRVIEKSMLTGREKIIKERGL